MAGVTRTVIMEGTMATDVIVTAAGGITDLGEAWGVADE
jgi:hypothetical protein